MKPRCAEIQRETAETKIAVRVHFDQLQPSNIRITQAPFLAHMLQQVAKHGRFSLDIQGEGDVEIDCHHLTEDIGITLGLATAEAVGDKKGIHRYGFAYCPLDEALSRVVIDFSGRPGLVYNCPFAQTTIKDYDLILIREFFMGFVNNAKVTLHLDVLRGENAHHQCESLFKAFGIALSSALMHTGEQSVPSTKGML